jgi:hypothetical protein
MRKAVLLAAVMLGFPSPLIAQSRGAPSNRPPEPVLPRRSDLACSRLVADLRALRAEALVQQGRDGGTLTAAHRDMIQTRLNAAWRRYYETRRRRRPCSG